MTYTRVGPFTDGGSPGINGAFLNGMENWIVGVDAPTGVSVSGQTSGTATVYQYLTGTIKRTVVQLNNYKNTANQAIVLPTAYTFKAAVQVYESQAGAIAFLTGGTGGTAVSIKIITALASGGGTQAALTVIKQWSLGQIDAPFDTIQFQINGGAANGLIVIEGI